MPPQAQITGRPIPLRRRMQVKHGDFLADHFQSAASHQVSADAFR